MSKTIAAQVPKKRSQLKEVWKRLAKNRLAVVGLVVLLLIIFLAIFAETIAPFNYAYQNHDATFQTPNRTHLFGTDSFGRDILSRVIFGTRSSLQIGFISLVVGAAIGCLLGAIAGFFGGWIDMLIMRFNDILMTIPRIVLAIAIASALGTGLTNAILALSISSIPNFVRVVHASTMTIKDQEYVEAARCIGAKNPRIIRRYVFPNVLAPIIVQATLGVGTTIILAAALSFLGLGIQPPTPEWGAMLSAARLHMRDFPHMVLFPGLAIMITVLALNWFGDGLRDALDPKLKK